VEAGFYSAFEWAKAAGIPGNRSSCIGIVCIAVTVFLREKMQSIAMFISGALISAGVVNIRSIGEFSGSFLGAEMPIGAGYGLYVVVLAGQWQPCWVLAWKDMGD